MNHYNNQEITVAIYCKYSSFEDSKKQKREFILKEMYLYIALI